eukprot:Opistho-2@61509
MLAAAHRGMRLLARADVQRASLFGISRTVVATSYTTRSARPPTFADASTLPKRNVTYVHQKKYQSIEFQQLMRQYDLTKEYIFSNDVPGPQVNSRDIFITNELSLTDVNVYGFDYDYTLANYTHELQYLIYDIAIRSLVEAKKRCTPKCILCVDRVVLLLWSSWCATPWLWQILLNCYFHCHGTVFALFLKNCYCIVIRRSLSDSLYHPVHSSAFLLCVHAAFACSTPAPFWTYPTTATLRFAAFIMTFGKGF